MGKELDKIAVEAERIVKKGKHIYTRVKKKYEPKYRGQYVAIEIESGEVFLGKTGVSAREKAHKKYPKKMVFLQKIGFDTAESVLRSYTEILPHGHWRIQ